MNRNADAFARVIDRWTRPLKSLPHNRWKAGLDKPWLPFGWYRLRDRLNYRCFWLGFWNADRRPLTLWCADDRGGFTLSIFGKSMTAAREARRA